MLVQWTPVIFSNIFVSELPRHFSRWMNVSPKVYDSTVTTCRIDLKERTLRSIAVLLQTKKSSWSWTKHDWTHQRPYFNTPAKSSKRGKCRPEKNHPYTPKPKPHPYGWLYAVAAVFAGLSNLVRRAKLAAVKAPKEIKEKQKQKRDKTTRRRGGGECCSHSPPPPPPPSLPMPSFLSTAPRFPLLLLLLVSLSRITPTPPGHFLFPSLVFPYNTKLHHFHRPFSAEMAPIFSFRVKMASSETPPLPPLPENRVVVRSPLSLSFSLFWQII